MVRNVVHRGRRHVNVDGFIVNPHLMWMIQRHFFNPIAYTMTITIIRHVTKGTVPLIDIRLLDRLTVFRWSHLESLAE